MTFSTKNKTCINCSTLLLPTSNESLPSFGSTFLSNNIRGVYSISVL